MEPEKNENIHMTSHGIPIRSVTTLTRPHETQHPKMHPLPVSKDMIEYGRDLPRLADCVMRISRLLFLLFRQRA